MYDYKTILGVAASVISVVSYMPYFRDMFRGETKPHPFSWFIWGLVSAIAFFAQIVAGGGIGAWTTGITAVACLTIAGLAVFFGEHHVSELDVVCFVGAIIGIIAWRVTGNPLTAVIIVLTVHLLGFIPTYRKGYILPHEETLLTYILSCLKWGVGLLALATINPTTALFPAGVLILNIGFSVMLYVRQKQVPSPRRSNSRRRGGRFTI